MRAMSANAILRSPYAILNLSPKHITFFLFSWNFCRFIYAWFGPAKMKIFWEKVITEACQCEFGKLREESSKMQPSPATEETSSAIRQQAATAMSLNGLSSRPISKSSPPV